MICYYSLIPITGTTINNHLRATKKKGKTGAGGGDTEIQISV
jgi:hypothetical protein